MSLNSACKYQYKAYRTGVYIVTKFKNGVISNTFQSGGQKTNFIGAFYWNYQVYQVKVHSQSVKSYAYIHEG